MSNKIFLIGLIVVFVPITSRIQLLVIGYLLCCKLRRRGSQFNGRHMDFAKISIIINKSKFLAIFFSKDPQNYLLIILMGIRLTSISSSFCWHFMSHLLKSL